MSRAVDTERSVTATSGSDTHATDAGATGPVSMVRALHGAAEVPGAAAPYDRLTFRLHHPASFHDTPQERQTGELPPDLRLAPWPVVVLFSGINFGAESYRWLAVRLAAAGIATVTFDHVQRLRPDAAPSLSPGLDLSALTPDAVASRPSSTTLGAVLGALGELRGGPLDGALDLERIAVGGHSAGGTAALLNADPTWFPGMRAAFSYAGHTMPAAVLGHPAGTVLSVCDTTPALVVGGDADGVVAASAVRYGRDGDDTHDPITATFEHGTAAPGSALAVLRGAGHLVAGAPQDPTSARGFLEPSPGPEVEEQRRLLGELVLAFCRRHLGDGPPDELERLADDPMFTTFRLR